MAGKERAVEALRDLLKALREKPDPGLLSRPCRKRRPSAGDPFVMFFRRPVTLSVSSLALAQRWGSVGSDNQS